MSEAYGMMLKGAFSSENTASAGIGLNFIGTYLSSKAIGRAGRAEQAQIDLQMQQNVLASTQQALANQDRLSYTLGLQRVLAASRGQQAGQGSALAAEQFSLREHRTEERNRVSTLQSAQAQAKQQKAAIGVNTENKKTQTWGALVGSTMQTISLNQMMGDYLNPAKRGKL